MKYRKYIRRLLKNPDKARCIACAGKMAFEDNTFTCKTCNKKVMVRGKKAKHEYKMLPVYTEREEPSVFKLVQYRMENKFYSLSDSISYNPVIKKLVVGDEYTTVNDNKHEDYIKEIQELLCK